MHRRPQQTRRVLRCARDHDVQSREVYQRRLVRLRTDDLVAALDAHGATYAAASGTVTRVATDSFGGMADEGGTAQIEIRASWTPLPQPSAEPGDPLDVAPHVEAWGELLCTAGGLEPVPDGVAVMPSRRPASPGAWTTRWWPGSVPPVRSACTSTVAHR